MHHRSKSIWLSVISFQVLFDRNSNTRKFTFGMKKVKLMICTTVAGFSTYFSDKKHVKKQYQYNMKQIYLINELKKIM